MAVQSGRREAVGPTADAGAAGEVVGTAGADGASPAFVGRDDALAAVTGALDRGPALVVVEGEAGIGKTRLLRECLSTPDLRARRRLVAACPALPEPFPLGAVLDGVRRLRPDVAALGLSPLGGALRPLFPEWVDELPPALEALEDPKETRHRLLAAITELVDRLGVELLVVEDAHWADSATLEWLLTLVAAEPANDGPGRSIVLTFRPWDIPEDSLLPRLTSRSPAGLPLVRVELEPLTTEHTRQLVASMFAADEVSEGFAEFLREHTGGVPLAVEEYVLLLQDRQDIVREDGTWARRVLDELEVPATVRDSVLERVTRLRPEARQVLEAAAVLADPADAATLTAVAELDEDAARRGVSAALASGLLQETDPGRYVFRHALDAQAIGDVIPVSERRPLHRQAAQALQKLDHPPVARLARHFREAGDTEQWCHYAEAAADLAWESGDDNVAVTMLHELLTSMDHPSDRRARLARKLGEAAAGGAASLIDRAGLVIDALRQVLASTDIPPGERGAIRLLLGRLLRWYGQVEAADREIEAAIPDLADRPGLACRAMLNLGIALSRDWPVQRHLAWVRRATAQLPLVEPEEWLAVAALRASALLALGEDDGWDAAAELPQVGSRPSEQRTVLLSMADVGRLAIKWGRYAEAGARLGTATAHIRAAGYERALSVARAGCAYLDWYTGRWDGLRDTVAGFAEEATEQASLQIEAREIQGLVELATGAREAAEEHLNAALDGWYRHAPHGHQAAITAAALARFQLADRSVKRALQLTGPVMTRIAKKGLWLWATDVIGVHLDALVHAGELEQADDLATQFAGWAADRNAPAPAAASLLCQAIVTEARGDRDTAVGLFAQAAVAWAGLPRPYDELLALERQGRCLLAADELDAGLAVLSQAQQRLQELGAKWDSDRVAHLLREHGVEIARPWRGGRRGYGNELSPRELEVVRLIARGMTNRQAAEVLFLSRRTVDGHLRKAMRKLGVSSRTAVAIAAAEAGLLQPDN